MGSSCFNTAHEWILFMFFKFKQKIVFDLTLFILICFISLPYRMPPDDSDAHDNSDSFLSIHSPRDTLRQPQSDHGG